MTALLVKLALYVTVLGAAGLAFAAVSFLAPGRAAARVLRAAAALAVAAVVFAVLRLAIDAASLAGGWSAVFEPPYLSWTLEAQAPFLTFLAAGAGIIAIAGMLGRRWPAAVGGVFALASFTATGHVAGAGEAWLRVVLAAHLAGAALWIVAPALLWPARSRGGDVLLARVRSFSRVAVGMVPLALAAGVIAAAALLERPADLTATAYGRLILVKAAAASAAFALGAANKLWVTARLAETPAQGRAALRATLASEACLFGVALAAVAAATTVFAPAG